VAIQHKKAQDPLALAVEEMTAQFMEFRQLGGVDYQGAIDRISQAAQKTIEALNVQIELLTQKNKALQAELLSSESKQEPLDEQDRQCTRHHLEVMANLKLNLDGHKQNIAWMHKAIKEQSNTITSHLKLFEDNLMGSSKDLAPGTLKKRWMDDHPTWNWNYQG